MLIILGDLVRYKKTYWLKNKFPDGQVHILVKMMNKRNIFKKNRAQVLTQKCYFKNKKLTNDTDYFAHSLLKD